VATTTHDIRVLTRTRHVAAAAAAFRTAMVGLPLPAFDDAHAAALAEPGRTLGAFDGGQVIGGAGSYTSWLTVPGGEAGTARRRHPGRGPPDTYQAGRTHGAAAQAAG
jgi:hypothetical protein